MMRFVRPVLLLLPLLLAGRPARAQEPVKQLRSDVYGITHDAAMEAAMARARETLPTFRSYLPRAAEGEVFAELKARFEQNGETEHMWVTDVSYKGGEYHGTLASTPVGLTNVSYGDPVTIGPDEVSDWVVVAEDNVMLGGFTIFVIRAMMDPKQRAEFDRGMGYRIPADGAIIAPPR
jgi:uncharacterized protein YegJ (DUF2314 family)